MLYVKLQSSSGVTVRGRRNPKVTVFCEGGVENIGGRRDWPR